MRKKKTFKVMNNFFLILFVEKNVLLIYDNFFSQKIEFISFGMNHSNCVVK